MEKRLQELDRMIEIALDCNRGECAAVMDFGAGQSDYMFNLSAVSPAALFSYIEKHVEDSLEVMSCNCFKVKLLNIEFYESSEKVIERIMKILFEAESREGRNYRLEYERRIF